MANRLLCFGAVYLYFMVDEPPVAQRAEAVRLMITVFFIGEILLSFSRGSRNG